MFQMNSTPSFRLSNTVLEAPDANALADFYRRLLGWTIKYEEPGWVILANPQGGPGLSFNTSEEYERPEWPPRTGEQQMMLHLDFWVDDLDAASRHALSEGAAVSGYQPQETVRVHLDPAGHPFCLFVD